MAFTISYKFLANDAFTKVTGKIAKTTDNVKKKIDKVSEASQKTTSKFKDMKSKGTSSFKGISYSASISYKKIAKIKKPINENITFTKKLVGQFENVKRQGNDAFLSLGLATALFKRRLKSLSPQIDTFKSKLKEAVNAGEGLRDVGKSMSTYLTLPIFAAGTASVVSAAKLETMQVSFESMLGSAEKAQAMMEKLKKFSATTPFQLPDISKSAKMLLSFGVAQEDVQKRLRSIGDIAAGVNAPIGDLALIFGQVKAKGKLMNEEMLQFAERGVPILDTLAKGLGMTKAQVQDMASKGKISFDLFLKAFEKTRELKFMNQMEKQSATLSGKWSTLTDNIMLGSAEIGNAIVETFGLKKLFDKAINFVQTLTEKFKKLKETNPGLRKTIVIVAAIVAAIGPLLVAIGTAVVAFKIWGAILGLFGLKSIATTIALKLFAATSAIVTGAMTVMTTAFKLAAAGARILALGIMSISWPVVAIVALVALVVGAIYLLWKHWDKVSDYVISASIKVKNYVVNVWNNISTYLSGVMTTIKNAMSNGLTAFLNLNKNIWGAIYNTISNIGSTICMSVKTTWESAKSFVSNTMESLRNKVSGAWESVYSSVSNKAAEIRQSITSPFTSAKSFAADTMESLREKISNVWESVYGLLSGKTTEIYQSITSPFTSAKEFLSGVLDSIGNTVNSIMSKVESVKSFFGDFGNNVSGFFQDKMSFGDTNVTENINLSGETLTSNKSQTDINMTLNAPKGVVKDVSHKSTGMANMNLGFNMVGAY